MNQGIAYPCCPKYRTTFYWTGEGEKYGGVRRDGQARRGVSLVETKLNKYHAHKKGFPNLHLTATPGKKANRQGKTLHVHVCAVYSRCV